jgi:hypothetical protein
MQIRAGQNKRRRLAAELQSNPFDVTARERRHAPPRTRGTGERHHVDVRMGHQRLADFGPGAVHQIEDPGRQAAFFNRARQQERTGRGNLRWLQNDGAACEQCWRHLPRDLVKRVIPGRDAGNDPHGRLDDERMADAALPLEFGCQIGIHVPSRYWRANLNPGSQFPRHADLARNRLGQFVSVG